MAKQSKGCGAKLQGPLKWQPVASMLSIENALMAFLGAFFEDIKMNEYKTIKETAEQWGISVRRIQKMCEDQRIPGVIKFGRDCAIPNDAEKPADARVKLGKYKDWRKTGTIR